MRRFVRFTLVFTVFATIGASLCAAQESAPPREFGGIYPSLGYFNDEGECGTGAVVPWAGKLWFVTYGPHLPNGSSDKLYELDDALRRTTRPESVGGTNANRMIHRESNQLFIGNHVIDAEGNVRTIPHGEMYGRETAVARSWLDPANKVYFLTMEEGLYEVDVHTLAVRELCKDGNRKEKTAEEDVLPGYHGKGGYMTQERLVYANNGEGSDAARHDPTVPSGCLAEWLGEDKGWRVIKRAQFTETTGPDGIYGGETGREVLWTLGWDVRSVILGVLESGEWRFFRLPKASHCYDGAHGWNTEWPRIRKIDDPNVFLATMHGQFWRFPRDFSASNAKGIRPRSTYLKVIGDFAFWNGRVVFGCDDAAKNEFLNKSPLKVAITGPGRSGSNLWFAAPERLDDLGPALGRGAVWLDDEVAAQTPSEPYLFAGYDRRGAFVKFDSAEFKVRRDQPDRVTITFEVDVKGEGTWTPLKTVSVPIGNIGGCAWVEFPQDAPGEWIRATADADLKGATCFFQYRNEDKRQPNQASPIFDGIATPEDAADVLGARLWVRSNNERLAVVAENIRGGALQEERYYELNEDGTKLERVECKFEGGEPGTISRVKAMVDAKPVAPDVCTLDDKSVLLQYEGARYRLPIGSESAARVETPIALRVDREVVTERDLLHLAGTFYELPAENAGGVPKLRPIATDGRLIVDYASYRGLLVLAGVKASPDGDSDRIVRSEDGECALWLGTIDDLWKFGKPTGRGFVWRDSNVKANEPSDPMLATGFDRKRVELTNRSPEPVVVTLLADATCNGDWRPFRKIEVPADGQATLELPDSFGAYWLRTVADRDATLSAEFVYE